MYNFRKAINYNLNILLKHSKLINEYLRHVKKDTLKFYILNMSVYFEGHNIEKQTTSQFSFLLLVFFSLIISVFISEDCHVK